jgi:hypothetical protein
LRARRRETITTDETTVITKPVLDAVVVENREGDRRFPDPTRSYESNRFEVPGKANDFLDEFLPPEAGSGRWGRWFSLRDAIQI